MKAVKNPSFLGEELIDNLKRLNEELSQSDKDQRLDPLNLMDRANQKTLTEEANSGNSKIIKKL